MAIEGEVRVKPTVGISKSSTSSYWAKNSVRCKQTIVPLFRSSILANREHRETREMIRDQMFVDCSRHEQMMADGGVKIKRDDIDHERIKNCIRTPINAPANICQSLDTRAPLVAPYKHPSKDNNHLSNNEISLIYQCFGHLFVHFRIHFNFNQHNPKP